MTFWFARNYCKLVCARRASRQPRGAGGSPGTAARCGCRAGPPSHGHPLGVTSLCPAGPQPLPAPHGAALGAALGAASALRGRTHRGGAGTGLRVRGDGSRVSPVPSSPGRVRARAGGSGAWEAAPAAGSGAPACSGRSSLDSCNVSVACLSFHGVSILQPLSVLIPGGRGRVFTLAPRGRRRDPSGLGMPEFYTQQQF